MEKNTITGKKNDKPKLLNATLYCLQHYSNYFFAIILKKLKLVIASRAEILYITMAICNSARDSTYVN